MGPMIRTIILTVLFVILDQVAKFQASAFIDEPVSFMKGHLIFQKSFNTGIAFGLKVPQIAIIVLSFFILAILVHLIYSEINLKKHTAVLGSSLVLGGALSNLVDRVMYGGVIDFIGSKYWPTFNLADVFIVVGVLIIVIYNRRALLK
jgi:signal peptidase II